MKILKDSGQKNEITKKGVRASTKGSPCQPHNQTQCYHRPRILSMRPYRQKPGQH